ncbi:MAG: tail fiber domain-containing protein [Candidatus Korobacteraceae bacterium]
MRRFRTTIVVAFATLLSVSISAQQTATTSVPNLIRYSGTLKDSQGAALSSSAAVGVTFSLYKQQEGGAPVWMETQNVTADANGQYNVILGSTTATGLPDDLFSQQEQRWLGVQVQGQAEQARVLLVSVPYAFKAHEAETLGGLPASAFVKAAPTEGLADGSNVTALNPLSIAGSPVGSSRGNGKTPSIKAPCSGAVTTSTGAPPDVIPLWGAPCDLVNTPASGTATVNGNLNLPGFTNSYQIGGFAMLRGRGTLAVYVGAFAGSSNTTGANNTFVGPFAGTTNVTGFANTYLGAFAGRFSTGSRNTFTGLAAGQYNTTGHDNAIYGASAGDVNLTGSENAFFGSFAGFHNTTDGNSFYGYQSGMNNTTGAQNTFIGTGAGSSNIAGSSNTITGFEAGFTATGDGNTFNGSEAGYGNTAGNPNTGSSNTMSGSQAGAANTTGSRNAFYGSFAGGNNTSGMWNVFLGQGAGSSTTTGSYNTYVGTGAGDANQVGSNNVFVGLEAGDFNGGGSNNIYIASFGATESNTIRIGTLGTQTDTYVQGIYNAPMPPTTPSKTVCVDSNGKLWGGHTDDPHCDIITSSRRFKDQIRDMGDGSSRLFQLRPVTFFYKPQYDDGSHTLQYGLIAEEVAKVYPDLVAYDRDGAPYTVKYQYLAPMLLNELQKQHTVVATQQDVIKTQQEQIQSQGQQIADLQQRLSRLESLIDKK